ncbi:phage virion morphogenesis protein, partial [Acinetobacter baumannii]
QIELNDAAVAAALGRLQELTRGQRPGRMRAIARYMLTATELRFRRQVGPDGAAWVRSRRAQREGGQTLRDSGRLRASLAW